METTCLSITIGQNTITTNQDIVQIMEKKLQIEKVPFTIEELGIVLR